MQAEISTSLLLNSWGFLYRRIKQTYNNWHWMLNCIHNIMHTVPLCLQQMTQVKSNPKSKIQYNLGNPHTIRKYCSSPIQCTFVKRATRNRNRLIPDHLYYWFLQMGNPESTTDDSCISFTKTKHMNFPNCISWVNFQWVSKLKVHQREQQVK